MVELKLFRDVQLLRIKSGEIFTNYQVDHNILIFFNNFLTTIHMLKKLFPYQFANFRNFLKFVYFETNLSIFVKKKIILSYQLNDLKPDVLTKMTQTW